MYGWEILMGLSEEERQQMTREEIAEYLEERDKKIQAIADNTFAECQKQGFKIADLECVIHELKDKVENLERNFKRSRL